MRAIYHTTHMESAIRYMVSRNDRCVLFKHHRNLRPIRLRSVDIKDLGGVLCQPKTPFADAAITRWTRERGLLYYEHSRNANDIMPKCDAMFVVECPSQYVNLEKYFSRVEREIIIYRPPNWNLHEETIQRDYPTSLHHATIDSMLIGFVGRELTPILQCALNLSRLNADNAAVFTQNEIAAISGIDKLTLGKALRGAGKHVRYDVLEPVVPPEDLRDHENYCEIEAHAPNYGNYRLIRFNSKMSLSVLRMVREGSVRVLPSIYVIATGGARRQTLSKVDALAQMYRADWYKVRNLVDSSPNYPVPPHIVAELTQIQSERSELSLFLARTFGKERSTPKE